MPKKLIGVFVLCLALSVVSRGGDTNNPGLEVTPTPTPEMSQEAAPTPAGSLLNDILVSLAPYVPSLFS